MVNMHDCEALNTNEIMGDFEFFMKLIDFNKKFDFQNQTDGKGLKTEDLIPFR